MEETLEVQSILTVGALKQFIAELPDDTQVVLDDNEGWFVNVSHVHKPILHEGGDGSDYSCLTLMFGPPFDSRQL